MKRYSVTLAQIAHWQAVATAAQLAAKSKRNRRDVQAFFANYERSLNQVVVALRAARLPIGAYHTFTLFDPKERHIQVAPFVDRVAHHALMAPLIKPLDDWQVATSFACRLNKGAQAAAIAAQRQCRRFPWYLKMDVCRYFDRIDHQRLMKLLRNRLRGDGLFRLIQAVLKTYQTERGQGLPIGALTSQHFANSYLTPGDRWLIAHPAVKGHCRYMDDTVVWCTSKAEARALYADYRSWLETYWALALKPAIIQQSRWGLLFCGYRLHPHHIRPSRRRFRQFSKRLTDWQQAYQQGKISAQDLQQNTDALLAMLEPGRSWHWRKAYFARTGIQEV